MCDTFCRILRCIALHKKSTVLADSLSRTGNVYIVASDFNVSWASDALELGDCSTRHGCRRAIRLLCPGTARANSTQELHPRRETSLFPQSPHRRSVQQ
jgi:hypothetical protein